MLDEYETQEFLCPNAIRGCNINVCTSEVATTITLNTRLSVIEVLKHHWLHQFSVGAVRRVS